MKVCFLLACLLAALGAAPASALSTSAGSAILIEAETGAVIYEHNADQQRLIASTTKIMTGLLALEMASPDDKVTVPDEAAGVEGSSMYLKAGQVITVRELLYGLMLQSGNDAAAALAIHCAGGLEAFAAAMNRKARELGMRGTSFANPHGLNAPGHHSTARDMAILARAAMQNPTFAAIVGSKYARVGDITVKNHNRMLWMYEGSDGIKTGYTTDAGRCLVSSATRDGMRLIAVTLNDRNDWGDHAALLDYGFCNYVLRVFCREGETVAQRPVLGGQRAHVNVVPTRTLALLLTREQAGYARVNFAVDRVFWAPVTEKATVGHLSVVLDGREMAACDLIAAEGVEPAQAGEPGFWERIRLFWEELVT